MTTHKIINSDSSDMSFIPDKSINLIITSPPYPMIEMWDDMFCKQNSEIKSDIDTGNGISAFIKMHETLNKTWYECDRILADNGFICINIGDATRTINDEFQLYSNHTQIINQFSDMGYSILPDIQWKKPSNSPNKFMGSGMYPAGAYVTYEHEYILIFRKDSKRQFKGQERQLRQKSAYFWEERNVWFSDLWEINGVSQTITNPKSSRNRNASFPLEIPLRLVNMYSIKGDTVLDPFSGLGITNLACMISNRNSIGIEIDKDIAQLAIDTLNQNVDDLNTIINGRIRRHLSFIDKLPSDKKDKCYLNVPHSFLVKTRQETALEIELLSELIRKDENSFLCKYQKY